MDGSPVGREAAGPGSDPDLAGTAESAAAAPVDTGPAAGTDLGAGTELAAGTDLAAEAGDTALPGADRPVPDKAPALGPDSRGLDLHPQLPP